MQSFQSPQPASMLVNLRDIIAAPARTLTRVSTVQTRTWWLPALLAALTPILHTALTLDMQTELARKMTQLQLAEIPPEQAEAAQAMMERMTQPAFLLGMGALQSVIGLIFAWILAMILLYFGIALLASPPRVNGLWAAVAWTWIPLALRPLAQLGWELATGQPIIYHGLSYFVATGDMLADAKNPLFALASFLDPFALWHLALIYVLARSVGKLGRGGGLFLTLFYALVQAGVRVLPVLLSAWIGMG